MYTFYDETPLLNVNIDGTGADCIALPEFSDFDNGFDETIVAFDDFFDLAAADLTRVSVDGSGSADSGGEFETVIDIEYAHTAAPQAPIRVYIAGLNDADDARSAFLDTLQRAVSDDACGSISLSIGVCPAENADPATSADTIYLQAAAQGQTVFAATGDDGSAAEILNSKGACVASKQRGVNETAASPNITSVGGTQSKPKYVKATGIVAGPASESVWHESFGSSGGGASQVFTIKPNYQNGVTPNDGVRDIPDISLLAAVKTPGYVFAYQGDLFCCGGGTSFASPYWAGIAALMEQMNGGRLGPINPELYSLASSNAAANGIRDVTKGANGFHGAKGFKAVPGYDQATGWGTPDISVFAHAYTGK